MANGDAPRAQFNLPVVTTTQRDLMVADVGTVIFNVTTSKINFCKTKSAGAGSWEAVTSA